MGSTTKICQILAPIATHNPLPRLRPCHDLRLCPGHGLKRNPGLDMVLPVSFHVDGRCEGTTTVYPWQTSTSAGVNPPSAEPRDSGSSWACPTYQSTSILSIPKPVNVPSLPRHVLHVQCAYLAKGYFFCWWNVLDAAALTVAWPVTLFGSVGGVRCRVHICHHHCVWHAAMIALVLIRTIWAMLSCSLSSLSQLHQLCLSWRAGPYCGAYRLSTTVPCHSDRCHCCCCYFDTPANP
jgi:hypothetical protein